jgi:hypothetical protein
MQKQEKRTVFLFVFAQLWLKRTVFLSKLTIARTVISSIFAFKIQVWKNNTLLYGTVQLAEHNNFAMYTQIKINKI